MSDFDFSTLSSSDFEQLVCDLLNEKEKQTNNGVQFKLFKDGKDKGIDFSYSSNEASHEIVGQAKHYYRSGYSNLFSDLKKELVKIKKINPNRYIIATSLDLSVKETEQIRELFDPYVKTIHDIFAKKDLNQLLDQYPIVLRNNFKLWYSNTNVISKIINYNIEGRSKFNEQELKRKIRLYVRTPSYGLAKRALEINKFVIISGEPGIGKTSLAELLSFELIKDGYSFYSIIDDIKEVERVIGDNSEKQVFYFDDFLGHNIYEIAKAKGNESGLLNLLRRIESLENKYLILTTRQFILNTAIVESENFRRQIKDKENILQLSEYSQDLKRQILKNHVEESSLSEDFKQVLKDPSVELFIINHENFYPRSIEFITSPEVVVKVKSVDYELFVKNNFNKPDEIWRHAYEQQIDDLERILLSTMLSFGDEAENTDLEDAFFGRIRYENRSYSANKYSVTLKKLMNGFIKISYETDDTTYYKFNNPSIVDFLIKYLKEKDNQKEVNILVNSVVNIKQLTSRFYVPFSNVVFQYNIHKALLERIENDNNSLIGQTTPNEDRLLLVLFLYCHLNKAPFGEIIINQLTALEDWSFLEHDTELHYFFKKFLGSVAFNQDIVNTICKIGIDIFQYLMLGVGDLKEAEEILKLFTWYFRLNKVNLFETDDQRLSYLNKHISDLFDMEIETKIDELLDGESLYIEEEVDANQRSMIELKNFFKKFNIEINADFSKYQNHNWEAIARANNFNYFMSKDD